MTLSDREELFARYSHLAYKAAAPLVPKCHQTAQDVLQDALLALWEAIPKVNEQGNPKTYLWLRARSGALDAIRKRTGSKRKGRIKNVQSLPPESTHLKYQADSGHSATEEVEREDWWSHVKEQLACDPRLAYVTEQYYRFGLNQLEIADRLGLSQAWVNRLKFEALAKLSSWAEGRLSEVAS